MSVKTKAETATKGTRKTRTTDSRGTSTKRKAASTSIRYVVNADGERQEVVMPVAVFEKLLDRIEDLEDARDAEAAIKADKWIAWEAFEKELDALD